jgi:hypothetical protein
MNEVLDRSGAVVTNRELQATTDRAGPTTNTTQPVASRFVDLTVPGPTAGSASRKLRLDRATLVGLRDDTGGKATFFTVLPGLPAVQVNGTYATLLTLLPE